MGTGARVLVKVKAPFAATAGLIGLPSGTIQLDLGFYCASDDNLFGGVPHASISIYLDYCAWGGGVSGLSRSAEVDKNA